MGELTGDAGSLRKGPRLPGASEERSWGESGTRNSVCSALKSSLP